MSSPRARFAKVLGTQAERILSFHALALDQCEPLAAIWLGVYRGNDGPKAALVTVQDCSGQPCTGTALQLGEADSLEPLAMVDMKGHPVSINLVELVPLAKRKLQPDGLEGEPALLLLGEQHLDTGENRQILLLCTLKNTPQLIWREVSRSVMSNGAGFKSFDFYLKKPENDGDYLDIVLFQTTIPAKGQIPYRPGPPLHRRFSLKGKAYTLIEE